MAAGAVFEIPAALIEREATGIELIRHVRSLWGVRADARFFVGTVKFADWLMSDPAGLPGLMAARGINIGAVLADTAVLLPGQVLSINRLSGGAIAIGDWARPFADSAVPDRLEPDREALAIVQGTLGAKVSGRLFRCIRGGGENRYILTGQGVSLALDRGSAADIVRCLAEALGIDLAQVAA